VTREEAIQELQRVQTNVARVLSDVRADTLVSQKWRNARINEYERRFEALTFAIEALEDLKET